MIDKQSENSTIKTIFKATDKLYHYNNAMGLSGILNIFNETFQLSPFLYPFQKILSNL